MKEMKEAVAEPEEPRTKKPPVRRGPWMVAIRWWSSDQELPSKIGNSAIVSNPNATPAPISTGGWQKLTRAGSRRTVSPGSSSIPLPSRGRSKGKSPVLAGGTRASLVGRPRNQFEVLGRLGEEGLGGPSSLGPNALKRARLQAGHVGRALQPDRAGEGPVQARKMGPKSARVKGKGVVPTVEVGSASPKTGGPELFHFSAGSARDLDSLFSVPPPVVGPSAAVNQIMLNGGDQDEGMEGVCARGPVDHEGAVAGMVRAIMPDEVVPQGDAPCYRGCG